MRQKNQGVTVVLSCQERKRFATFIQLLVVIDQRANKRQAKPKKTKTNRVPKGKSDGVPVLPHHRKISPWTWPYTVCPISASRLPGHSKDNGKTPQAAFQIETINFKY